jgi:glyoxylase-like metal-dependent hydrolase (beta-lactamase superfamily II)
MSDQLQHGEVVRLTPRLRRITAPNPGMMTGAGTNTYLLGDAEVAVVDPGPLIGSHVDAILKAAEGRLKWIFVTHTHADHSPAAKQLSQLTGALKLGMPSTETKLQDLSFTADKPIEHDYSLQTDEFTLRAIHTPGHVHNHICYLLEDDSVLMAGDHVMNGSTVVIVPPQGKMKDYIESLQRLKHYPIASIAPGHGEIIAEPHAVFDSLVKHRLAREAKVLDKLALKSKATLHDLVIDVYDDVNPQLHTLALNSLEAHLIKLRAEQLVCDFVEADASYWRVL